MTRGDMHAGKKLLTRREFLVGGGAVVAAVAVAACTNKTTIAPTNPQLSEKESQTINTTSTLNPKYGGNLKVITATTTYSSFGWPSDFSFIGSEQLVHCSLETLLRGNNEMNLVPWLAKTYQLADDRSSITFNLRDGVTFHDGSNFNAQVAKWNLDNYIKAGLQSKWASVEVVDDLTVKVNFTEWNITLPSSFADVMNPILMVSKASFDNNGLDYMRNNPVGTGPFKFDNYQRDVGMKFIRNQNFWIKDKPYLDKLEYTFIADSSTQKMALQTGEGDMIKVVGGKQASDMTKLGLNVFANVSENYCLVPDTANPDSPWSKQEVREAVEYAIDKEAIAKAFGYGYSEAAYQIPAKIFVTYNPDFNLGRKYDPQKAKQLLAEAGYADGLNTTIICMPDPAYNDMAAVIQSDLGKVGINVKLDFPETGRWMTYVMFGTSWTKNSALFMTAPSDESGLLEFPMYGKNWLRSPELLKEIKNAQISPSLDINKMRAVTDVITRDALLIPVIGSVTGRAQKPFVIADPDFSTRGFYVWNIEDTWLNK